MTIVGTGMHRLAEADESRRSAVGAGFELVLVERDDQQAIYESWVELSRLAHGFHRYRIATGCCMPLDLSHPTSCQLSISTKIGTIITRELETTGELPGRVVREYW